MGQMAFKYIGSDTRLIQIGSNLFDVLFIRSGFQKLFQEGLWWPGHLLFPEVHALRILCQQNLYILHLFKFRPILEIAGKIKIFHHAYLFFVCIKVYLLTNVPPPFF